MSKIILEVKDEPTLFGGYMTFYLKPCPYGEKTNVGTSTCRKCIHYGDIEEIPFYPYEACICNHP